MNVSVLFRFRPFELHSSAFCSAQCGFYIISLGVRCLSKVPRVVVFSPSRPHGLCTSSSFSFAS